MTQQNPTEENRAEQAEAEAIANPTETPTPKKDAHASLEKLQLENAELRDKLLRWQADFSNLQRRAAREVLESEQRAAEKFSKDLLSVLDHLDAALASTADYKTLFNGVKITNDEFKKLLANRGIESFDPTGQPFDPHQHEAVMQEASADQPPMTVLQTFQPGYKSADRVLRPAKVKVSK
jgi:molecular chaperone GrpE